VSHVAPAERLPLRWAHALRHRAWAPLDYASLRWYRDVTNTYRLTADYLAPAGVRLMARLTIEGLEHIPAAGAVILAANHRDNLDAPLLMHVVPRALHFAARPDGFGTGGLCAYWRRLGAFPADAWGMRHGLTLLADGRVVALFVQGRISPKLETTSGATGLLALRSGAPVIPVAISGTEAVHMHCLFGARAPIRIRFGAPITFVDSGRGGARSLAICGEILERIGVLLSLSSGATELTRQLTVEDASQPEINSPA
jgi:1-acyl-sn-glycerol-3-phosphate acyltransferase